MSSISDQVRELLSRNLFLIGDIKDRILTADSDTQAKIFPVLQQMDEKQTELFRKILEKNPHFFGDLENMAIHEALKKIVATEEKHHLKEMINAEKELETMLTNL